MSHKSVTPIVNVPKEQLHDDVVEKMVAAGFSEQDLATYLKQLTYRKQYNNRPEVKARRAEYAKARAAKMKMIASLLK